MRTLTVTPPALLAVLLLGSANVAQAEDISGPIIVTKTLFAPCPNFPGPGATDNQ